MLRATTQDRASGPRLREFTVMAAGGATRVSYAEWGPAKAERTVVCAHGLTRNGRDFDFLAQRLARAGMRVVAPDLPGRGRSEWRPDWHEYGTPLYLSVMGALLARLDIEAVDWVGTSLGGHIGMEIAALSGTPIRRLVLNDFGARVGAAALQRISSYVASGSRLRFATLDEAEAHLRKIFAPFGALTDEQWRHMVEHTAVDAGDGRLRLNYDPAISKQFWWPIMLDISLWSVWDKVACPTLLIYGRHSDLLSAHTVRDMQRRGKAAAKGLVSTVEIADCGHAPALMDDHQIGLIENFLVADDAGAQAGQRRSAGAAG